MMRHDHPTSRRCLEASISTWTTTMIRFWSKCTRLHIVDRHADALHIMHWIICADTSQLKSDRRAILKKCTNCIHLYVWDSCWLIMRMYWYETFVNTVLSHVHSVPGNWHSPKLTIKKDDDVHAVVNLNFSWYCSPWAVQSHRTNICVRFWLYLRILIDYIQMPYGRDIFQDKLCGWSHACEKYC